MHTVERPTS